MMTQRPDRSLATPLALFVAAGVLVAAPAASAQAGGEGAMAPLPTTPEQVAAAAPVPAVVNAMPLARLVISGDFTDAEATIVAMNGPNGMMATVATCNQACELHVPPGRYRIAIDAAANRREFERDFDVPPEGVRVTVNRGRSHGGYYALIGVGIASAAVGVVCDAIALFAALISTGYGSSGSSEGIDLLAGGGLVLIVGGVGSIVAGAVLGSRGRRERFVIGPPTAARTPPRLMVGAMPMPGGLVMAAGVTF